MGNKFCCKPPKLDLKTNGNTCCDDDKCFDNCHISCCIINVLKRDNTSSKIKTEIPSTPRDVIIENK